jgi:DNA primase
MTAKSSEEAKEEVRSATDIVALVGERVPLRRAGRAWKGLCPFHAEKTPSFTVNPERQIWHCFGCNRGGDAFSFLMELDRLTFPEALAALAERAGVELPRAGGGAGDARRDRLYQANAIASDFFQASLRSEAGAAARAYLAGRGFAGAILDCFRVGWAPDRWDGLVAAAGKLLPGRTLEEAGLAVRRGDGTHYDRFRNRVIFPIDGPGGKVAGFGARALAPEDTPKYLNTPETPVYRKGAVLFGLPAARQAIRERRQVLVAEGYLDVMRLHAAGRTNAVSTCGTALTIDQARALARFDAEVVLVYDGDDAGVRAADRALDPLLNAGLLVRVLLLPEGEDPDSFLARRPAAEFDALLEEAGDPAMFLARAGVSGRAANPSPEARVRRYVELLARVEDPIRKRMLVRRGSAVFGIEEDVLLEALAKGAGGRRKAAVPRPPATPGSRDVPAGGAPQAGSGREGPAGGAAWVEAEPAEKELAARCLTEEGALLEVAAHEGEAAFRTQALRELLRPWLSRGTPPLPDELRDLLEGDAVARALLAEQPVEEGRTDEMARKGARELLQRLEERRLKASIQELDRAIRQAERGQDSGSLERLVAERRDLASKLHRGTATVL